MIIGVFSSVISSNASLNLKGKVCGRLLASSTTCSHFPYHFTTSRRAWWRGSRSCCIKLSNCWTFNPQWSLIVSLASIKQWLEDLSLSTSSNAFLRLSWRFLEVLSISSQRWVSWVAWAWASWSSWVRTWIWASNPILIAFCPSKFISQRIFHCLFFHWESQSSWFLWPSSRLTPAMNSLTLFLFFLSFVVASYLFSIYFSLWPRLNLSSFLSKVT